MSKQSEYQRGREDGLDLALRIVRQDGLQGLEDEVKFRNITGISTSLAKKDLNQACTAIKERTLDTFTILGIAVLHDDFGFGEKRCQRFMDGLNRGADYLLEDLATWDDYIQAIKEETGLKLEIRWK